MIAVKKIEKFSFGGEIKLTENKAIWIWYQKVKKKDVR